MLRLACALASHRSMPAFINAISLPDADASKIPSIGQDYEYLSHFKKILFTYYGRYLIRATSRVISTSLTATRPVA